MAAIQIVALPSLREKIFQKFNHPNFISKKMELCKINIMFAAHNYFIMMFTILRTRQKQSFNEKTWQERSHPLFPHLIKWFTRIGIRSSTRSMSVQRKDLRFAWMNFHILPELVLNYPPLFNTKLILND
jgi:hypothetical protein